MATSRFDLVANEDVRTSFTIHRRAVVGGLLAAALIPALSSRARAAEPVEGLPLIMLDPGHGGHDPGAIGVTGLYEKHVAFATAQDLKQALEASGRYRVMLTRDDDVYVPLERRAAYAQTHGARLFVSIHADALSDRAVRGASVYTLSGRASDAQSDELARKENSVDPAAMKDYEAYSPEVATILESLAARETRVLSSRLQDDIVGALADKVVMLHRPSRRANFVVLRDSLPSVLVEMGFMSNRADEMLLEQPGHRKEVVAALQQGVERCMTTFAELRRVG